MFLNHNELNIVYVDEPCFNLSTPSQYGRARIGEEAIVISPIKSISFLLECTTIHINHGIASNEYQ